ncbi:MAG TPA: acyltransferase family protein [Pseudomonas sp.]|uniref:acyltransferase family protein n=1 Tax=Pseudomonas sp. TaxID=306 RepID=UPI002BD26E68|nr:acyltransferase family protein [Pseudomonas sp.]HTO19358.1 acyltransferase family protein [Pseudomonas sp.]
MTTGTPAYNPGIDGLRALAVLAVFVFHLDHRWLPGGFLGVDIFFVISGFLITSILLKEMAAGRFSWAEFYRRRIKRILPAYLFMLTGVTLVAFLVMLPYDFKKYAVSAFSSLFFLSNLNYALRQGDYFSTDAEQWPLLHTWSLAVEEQFYLFWPVILFGLFALLPAPARRRRLLLPVLLALTLLSVLGASWLSGDSTLAKWSYYSVFTRAFELLVGAGLAVLKVEGRLPPLDARVTAPALLVLLASLVLHDASLPFPSFTALIPCLATAILLAGAPRGAVYRLLSWKPLVGIGLLSYSLYLWHWPLVSFTRYLFDFGNGEFRLAPSQAAGVVAAAFVLAWFSYRFIETPIKNARLGFRPAFVRFCAVPNALGALVFGAIFLSHGAPFRLDTEAAPARLAFNSIDKQQCPDFVSLGCPGGDRDSPRRYLIIGNSYAEHYFKFYDTLGRAAGIRVDLAASGGCGPHDSERKCLSVYNYVFEHERDYDGFILVQAWSSLSQVSASRYAMAIGEYLQRLKSLGRPILLVAGMPRFNADIDKVANHARLFGLGSPPIEVRALEDHAQENATLERYSRRLGTKFVDPFREVTASGLRLQHLDANGTPWYRDSNHLSVYGAERLARHVLATLPAPEISARYFP